MIEGKTEKKGDRRYIRKERLLEVLRTKEKRKGSKEEGR